MSKTVDDLLKIMERVSSDFYSLPADLPVRHLYQAQVVAVVRALRDEMDRQRGDDWRWGDTVYFFNEILGDAGNEKVAGACADGTVVQRQRYGENDRQSKDGAEVSPRHPDPATDPAPAVCVWTHKESWIGEGASGEAGCDGARRFRRRKRNCPSCGKPIRFAEAK